MTRIEALLLINNERQRQIHKEGFNAIHDDAYKHGELLKAAKCYAEAGEFVPRDGRRETISVPDNWPWRVMWWRPTTRVRNLVKAGALMMAEKDRLTRAGLILTNEELEKRLTLEEIIVEALCFYDLPKEEPQKLS